MNSSQSEPAALTLFEFLVGGHAPNFMRLMLEAWSTHATGRLEVVVSNEFLHRHASVFDGQENGGTSRVRWTCLDPESDAIVSAVRSIANDFPGSLGKTEDARLTGLTDPLWHVVNECSQKLRSRHVLLMNLDEYLLPLGKGRLGSTDFSGIFFLPSYVYRSETSSLQRRVLDTLQERLLPRLLNHPQLRVAFFLDPWVADSLADIGSAQVTYLPDPVRLPSRRVDAMAGAQSKLRLGLPSERMLFLFFGDIRSRKGVWPLMNALNLLSESEQGKICLAIVGHAESSVETRLSPLIEGFTDTPLAVVRRASYVDEQELSDWFTAADVVLAPYLHHVGMSSILLLAAAYRRPVICQDFGPMARLTRENKLGLAIKSRDPAEIARAMRRFLEGDIQPEWDPEAAHALAKRQSHENFGRILFDALRPFIS